MKFKCINSIKDIQKIIKSETRMFAPFDENNLSTDFMDDLFEGNYAVKNDQDYMGFIGSTPTFIRVMDNHLMIKPIFGITNTTDANILLQFSRIFNVSMKESGESDENSELVFTCETEREYGYYYVSAYFGKYIGK